MAKNVLIIASNGFEDVEMIAVRDILIRSGFEVEVSYFTDEDFVKSSYGLKIVVENKIKDTVKHLDKYDALFIPGGPGIEIIDDSEYINDILRHFISNNKHIGAICAAPSILAKRGILKDKKAIVYPDKKYWTIFKKYGVIFSTKECVPGDECSVVYDDKITTGMNMQSSIKFGYEFAKNLENNR